MNLANEYHKTIDQTGSGMILVSIAVILLMLVLTSCDENVSGNDDDDCPSNAECVDLTSMTYVPANIVVNVGTTVVWINNSNVTHTVTSGSNGEQNNQFNSGNLNPGGEFSFTFTETGTFAYFCIPHFAVGMTGTVTVVDGNGD